VPCWTVDFLLMDRTLSSMKLVAMLLAVTKIGLSILGLLGLSPVAAWLGLGVNIVDFGAKAHDFRAKKEPSPSRPGALPELRSLLSHEQPIRTMQPLPSRGFSTNISGILFSIAVVGPFALSVMMLVEMLNHKG
jgi:hypothetical protein